MINALAPAIATVLVALIGGYFTWKTSQAKTSAESGASRAESSAKELRQSLGLLASTNERLERVEEELVEVRRREEECQERLNRLENSSH